MQTIVKTKGKQLVIFIPYSDKSTRRLGDDCVANSKELFEVVKKYFTDKKEVSFHGQLITSALLVHASMSETVTIKDDSIVIMHAYGGEINGSLWDDNRGKITVKEGINLLDNLKGNTTVSEFHFPICYSALKGHIATLWKKKYPNAKVFGTVKEFEGKLYTETNSRLEINTLTNKEINIIKAES